MGISTRLSNLILIAILIASLLSLLCASGLPANALPQSVQIKLADAGPGCRKLEVRGAVHIETVSRANISGKTHGRVFMHAGKKGIEIVLPAKTNREYSSNPLIVPGAILTPRSSGGLQLIFDNSPPRRYLGRISVRLASGEAARIQSEPMLEIEESTAPLEYICGVVAAELPGGCPPQVWKAIAVLALNKLETTIRPGRVMSDSTKDQAYGGCGSVSEEMRDAVRSVMPYRLEYQGRMISSYYHSTCAGGTSSGEAIFGESARTLKYLTSVDCDHCKLSPFWTERRVSLNSSQIEKMFGKSVCLVESDEQGRPVKLVFLDVNGRRRIRSGYQTWLSLGRELGWGAVPGTRYRLEPQKDGGLVIVSRGAGHGVGLCQWGAIELANQGKSYREILQYYFPACRLKNSMNR